MSSGAGRSVVEQPQLSNNIENGVTMLSGCDGINEDKGCETNYHHTEKLYPVVFDKADCSRL